MSAFFFRSYLKLCAGGSVNNSRPSLSVQSPKKPEDPMFFNKYHDLFITGLIYIHQFPVQGVKTGDSNKYPAYLS